MKWHAVDVYEDLLEGLVHVERLAGHVLPVPDDAPVIDVERQRGVGVERRVGRREPAAGRHPRLGLRGAEVDETQLGVPTARDPDVRAASQFERVVAPSVTAGLAGAGHRVGAPELLAGARIVGGDEAALLLEASTSTDACDDLAVGHDGAGTVGEAQVVISDLCLPAHDTGARVERDQVGVERGHQHQVLPDREAPQVAPSDAGTLCERPAVLP